MGEGQESEGLFNSLFNTGITNKGAAYGTARTYAEELGLQMLLKACSSSPMKNMRQTIV